MSVDQSHQTDENKRLLRELEEQKRKLKMQNATGELTKSPPEAVLPSR